MFYEIGALLKEIRKFSGVLVSFLKTPIICDILRDLVTILEKWKAPMEECYF